jgi:hypothetical protein
MSSKTKEVYFMDGSRLQLVESLSKIVSLSTVNRES